MYKKVRNIWLPVIAIPLSIVFALMFVSRGTADDQQRAGSPRLHTSQSVTLAGDSLISNAVADALLSPPKPASTNLLTTTQVLPIIFRSYPWMSPFGAEVNILSPIMQTRAQQLGLAWLRMPQVSWRAIQANENDPYDWSVLSSFDEQLRLAQQAGITPIVVIQHFPRWATINVPFETDCGAIRTDKFGQFAAFMQALVNRYKSSEFNVHYWEIGNEPDVDPTLVNPDLMFGCWGDINDPYYGGRQYGEMLKVVTPAIKAADPSARVLVGGLLLGRPQETNPALGHPERFINGILEAGAAPYFDILPYHEYPSYIGETTDYDNGYLTGNWEPLGGLTLGKARFLRQIMAQYGTDKPLFVNETALVCNPDWYTCDPAPDDYFQAQADYLVRTVTRGLSEDIRSYIWYTLSGPGWRSGGLLDGAANPRPGFIAYQNLIARLQGTRFVQKPNYGPDVEAYSFTTGPVIVHVLWSIDATPDTITTPQSTFLAAYDRDGAALAPTAVGSSYQFSVGFSPIFLELRSP
jgi:hypothetical protein